MSLEIIQLSSVISNILVDISMINNRNDAQTVFYTAVSDVSNITTKIETPSLIGLEPV